ncbi:MAG: MIP/aquaporin family protein [Pseudomonadota bacterium]
MAQRLLAEAVGTAFLLIAIVGSGIMAEGLAGPNGADALFANAAVVGATLIVLILIFAPVSGAHFNPAVTLAFFMRKEIGARDASLYVAAQIVGAIIGVFASHAMFGEPVLQVGTTARDGGGQLLGELIATFGLLATIFGCIAGRKEAVPYAVGLYIFAAIWFTSSTCFANPAVTIARALTDTYTAIRPIDAPAFIIAELAAAAGAALAAPFMFGVATEARAGEEESEATSTRSAA